MTSVNFDTKTITNQRRMGWFAPRTLGAKVAISGLRLPWDRVSQRQIQAALAGYPVFHPPHIGGRFLHHPEKVAENFAYFKAMRPHRSAHLAYFLEGLDVERHDDEALDTWFVRYGSSLVPGPAHLDALERHTPSWSREHAGLNVILDIAIRLAERAEATGWQWEADAAGCGANAIPVNGTHRFNIVRRVAQACNRTGYQTHEGLRPVRQILACHARAEELTHTP